MISFVVPVVAVTVASYLPNLFEYPSQKHTKKMIYSGKPSS
jgi:hypothetical protein